MPARVSDVPISHLPYVWPQVEAFLVKALREDERFTIADVLDHILSGRCRLWASYDAEREAFEAAMVTEIVQFPRLRECRVWLIGGRNMKAWVEEFRLMIEAYARAEKCKYMSGGGRRGWARIAGYHDAGPILVKEL